MKATHAALSCLVVLAGCGAHAGDASQGATSEARSADSAKTHASTFDYAPSGLPKRITTDGVARDIVAPPVDALGRATSIPARGASLAYGADGALASATRGADHFDFVVDETGHRIAKRKNGAIVEAYVPEGLVTEDALYAPVRVDDRLVGLVHGGAFESVATDARGSLVGDDQGATLAEPFGERVRSSDVERALDYAQSGRDTDLGVVRMGLRDYDPEGHRFLTPDPLFFAHPDKCVEDPVSCDLYAYARNRPLDFVDPNGTDANFILAAQGGPIGAELIVGEKSWSLKVEIGAMTPGYAVGITSKDPAHNDASISATAEAKAKAGPLNIGNAKVEVKTGTSGTSAQGSAGVLFTGGSLKVDQNGVKPSGDVKYTGLPSQDATFEAKLGGKLAMSVTINSADIANIPHEMSLGMRAGAELSRFMPALRHFFGTEEAFEHAEKENIPFMPLH